MSAAALIADAGSFEPDDEFRPSDFLAQHFPPASLDSRIARNRGLRDEPPEPSRRDAWYATSRTIDRRVSKLRAFETVTASSASVSFAPDGTLRDTAEIVERSARHVAQFVRDVESRFPRHQHVVLTGGKDSQLIWLAPKADASRWHVLSAEPNRPIVAAWMERNGVWPGRVFGHDTRNDESAEDLERKIVCGDLMSDPTHIRWMPAMARIHAQLGGACLFWGGTMSGPAHVFAGAHRRLDGTDRDAFRHLDPAAVTKETDLRDRIGERLLGRPVGWPAESPGPARWIPKAYLDARAVYLRHVRDSVASSR